MNIASRLEVLTASVQGCYACRRMDHCHVLGAANGATGARVMFVGEAPGRLGAGRSGVPFSGDESGRRFESLLSLAGLRRDEVFVTNAVLCNPLDGTGRNRRPLLSELAACRPHLQGQIEAVDPAIVVALGGVGLEALGRIEAHGLKLATGIGQAIDWDGRRLVALYHPGRRAIVHRADALQQADWQAFGDLVRAVG